MALQRVVVEITGSPKELDSTIHKLEQLGKVDKANADQFNKSHETFKRQVREKEGEVGRLESGIKLKMERIAEYFTAAFAAERVAEWTKEAIDAFEEVQKAANELKFTTTNVAGEGINQFKKLQKQADELSNSINNLFSPKQIMNAQSMLLRAGLSSEQVMKMLPRIADIAAKTGKPLDELAQSFDRAISGGRAQELRQLGINFQSTGDKVKDFNLIMQNSAQYVGGATDAMGDLANQAVESQNKLEILQEEIGSKLAPAWEDLKLEILGSAKALVDFFTFDFKTPGDALLKYFNALTLNLPHAILDKFGIHTLDTISQKQTELTERLKNKTLSQIKDMMVAVNKGIIEGDKSVVAGMNVSELYTFLANIVKEREGTNEQMVQDTITSEQELTKLSLNELNIRLEAAKNENKIYVSEHGKSINDMEHLNSMGFEKEAARINKEIERRKHANEKLLELQKKFQEELLAISESIEKDKDRLAVEGAKTEIEKQILQEKMRFDEEISAKRKQSEKLKEIILKGTKEEAAKAQDLQDQIYADQEEAEKVHQKNLQKIQDEFEQKALERIVKERDRDVEIRNQFENEMLKRAKLDADKRLMLGKIDQDNYNVEIANLELAAAKDKADNDKTMFDRERAFVEEQHAIGKLDEQEYINALHEIDLKRLKDETDIQEKEKNLAEARKKAFKQEIKDRIDDIKKLTQFIVDGLIAQSEAVQKANDYRISQQDSLIQTQRTLAEAGLKNDLAFEEKRRAMLEAQNIREVQKQKKLKELMTFLNSVEEFSKTDPKTALPKALGVLASVKAAEAVFAEEGGLIGTNDRKSLIGAWGASIRHKSGNDVLIHGERGEMVLPKEAVANLGINAGNHRQFIAMLKNPAVKSSSPLLLSTEGIEKAIEKGLEKIPHITVDDHKNIVETVVRNGIKTRTVHKF